MDHRLSPRGRGDWLTGCPLERETGSQVVPERWRLDHRLSYRREDCITVCPLEGEIGLQVVPLRRGTLDHTLSLRGGGWITGCPIEEVGTGSQLVPIG